MRLFYRREKLNNITFEGFPSSFFPWVFFPVPIEIQKLLHMQIRAPTVNTCTVQYTGACRIALEQYPHYVLCGGMLHQCICKCLLLGWILAESEPRSVSLKSGLNWSDHFKAKKMEVENKIQKIVLSVSCVTPVSKNEQNSWHSNSKESSDWIRWMCSIIHL